jgi:hypothetical protein
MDTAMRGIFGSQWTEVMKELRKSHIQDLHDFCPSDNIISSNYEVLNRQEIDNKYLIFS